MCQLVWREWQIHCTSDCLICIWIWLQVVVIQQTTQKHPEIKFVTIIWVLEHERISIMVYSRHENDYSTRDSVLIS